MKTRAGSAVIGLRLGLHGLWYRRSTALIVLVLAIVGSAAAVVAPLYSRAASESIVRDTVRRTDAFSRGVHISHPQTDQQQSLKAQDRASFPERYARQELTHRAFGPIEVAQQTHVNYHPTAGPSKGGLVVGRLVERSNVCQHLPTLKGSCPHSPGEGLVARRSLAVLGIKVGDTLSVDLGELVADEPTAKPPRLAIRVVGTYAPVPVNDSY